MLENVKSPGDLVSAARSNDDEAYVEGVVRSVDVDDEGDYFYEIVWEDGKNFGDLFYEEELDEIDIVEQEAVIRFSLQGVMSEEVINEWLIFENSKLKGMTPYEALNTLGLNRVARVAISDLVDALNVEES